MACEFPVPLALNPTRGLRYGWYFFSQLRAKSLQQSQDEGDIAQVRLGTSQLRGPEYTIDGVGTFASIIHRLTGPITFGLLTPGNSQGLSH